MQPVRGHSEFFYIRNPVSERTVIGPLSWDVQHSRVDESLLTLVFPVFTSAVFFHWQIVQWADWLKMNGRGGVTKYELPSSRATCSK